MYYERQDHESSSFAEVHQQKYIGFPIIFIIIFNTMKAMIIMPHLPDLLMYIL